MKNKTSDKQIKEKMQSLDTLSGGIVFGREAAWDKLQARLEQQPAKRIPIRYRMAAAAMLLLSVCIMALYYKPSKQAEIVSVNQVNSAPIAAPIIQRQQPVPAQNENMPAQKISTATLERKQTTRNNSKEKKTAVSTFASVQPIQKPMDENKTEQHVVTAITVAPVITITKPMKVIYIGDLERNDRQEQPLQVSVASDGIDLSKLKTFNIYELEREDVAYKQLLRLDNKLTFGQRFLFKPVLNYYTAQPEEYTAPRNAIKTIFNIQN